MSKTTKVTDDSSSTPLPSENSGSKRTSPKLSSSRTVSDIKQILANFKEGDEDYDSATQQIQNLLVKSRIETEKAFGGCKKCYGKGYSTVWSGLTGANDFTDHDGFVTPPHNNMRFCTCERGKQLESTLKSGVDKHE